MTAAHNPVLRAHDLLTTVSTYIGGAALGASTLMYIYEVAVRYFFNAPTTWTSDWTSYLLVIVIFAVAPELCRRGGHIAIELLPENLPSTPRRVLETVTMALAAAVCLTSGWIAFEEAIQLFDRGVVTIASAKTQKWWIMAVIVYGFFNSGLYFIRHCYGIATRSEPHPKDVSVG